IDQAADEEERRIEDRRRGNKRAVRRVKLLLAWLDIAERLVARIVVEGIELRQLRKPGIRVDVIVIAGQDDLVIDAVEIEQFALDVRIQPREWNAAPQSTPSIKPAARFAGQVGRVLGQVDYAVRHQAHRTERKGKAQLLEEIKASRVVAPLSDFNGRGRTIRRLELRR